MSDNDLNNLFKEENYHAYISDKRKKYFENLTEEEKEEIRTMYEV